MQERKKKKEKMVTNRILSRENNCRS